MRLSEGNAIRYVGRLFGIREFADGKFHRWSTAQDYMQEHIDQSRLPEGLVQAFLDTDRCNIIGTVWNLSTRCLLWQHASEVMDSDNQCYMLVSDQGLPGAEGMFLLAAGIYATRDEAVEDMSYHLGEWGRLAASNGCTGSGLCSVTGGLALPEGYGAVQAVRLSSMKQRYSWGDATGEW